MRRERRHEDVLEIFHLLHADHVGVQRDRRRPHARQPQLGAQRVGGARAVVLRVAREQRLREHVVRREAQRRRWWCRRGGAAAHDRPAAAAGPAAEYRRRRWRKIASPARCRQAGRHPRPPRRRGGAAAPRPGHRDLDRARSLGEEAPARVHRPPRHGRGRDQMRAEASQSRYELHCGCRPRAVMLAALGVRQRLRLSGRMLATCPMIEEPLSPNSGLLRFGKARVAAARWQRAARVRKLYLRPRQPPGSLRCRRHLAAAVPRRCLQPGAEMTAPARREADRAPRRDLRGRRRKDAVTPTGGPWRLPRGWRGSQSLGGSRRFASRRSAMNAREWVGQKWVEL